MRVDNFLLMSGEDIPLLSSNIIVHTPTIQEIVNIFLYENKFLTGFEFLFFSKDKLDKNEQQILQSFSDYEILLMLLQQDNVTKEMKEQLDNLKQFLELLLRNYKITYKDEYIVLNQDEHIFTIDEKEFNTLKSVVLQMFPFKHKDKGQEYNPQNRRAREIAEKLKKGREKIAKKNAEAGITESIFEKYTSILSIGLQIPIKTLYQCTVYQLLNMFERYEKKEVYDVYLNAQMAGATGMKEVDHWMM